VGFEGAGKTKTDNNPRAFTAKVDIRRRVMQAIGDETHIFDCFAGAGEMHAAIWSKATSYTGCDIQFKPLRGDTRLMFAADNRRVLRAVDLSRFNIFDLDAYGSPYEQMLIIADRRSVRSGETIGVVITDGTGLAQKANVVPIAVRTLARVKSNLVGVFKNRDLVLDRVLLGFAARMRCVIAHRWQADGKTGMSVRYVGLVLRGR
jgi:hypothetical protein